MPSDFSQCLYFIHISGSSSIGSVDARFLAAFAAAAGKKSVQSCESEESDPDVRNMRSIIFIPFDFLNTVILKYSYYLILIVGLLECKPRIKEAINQNYLSYY